MNKINDSHFEILGVNRHSTSEEIRKAFKNLIKKNHPDRFPNDEDKSEATRKSQKLIEAFNLLRNYKSEIKDQTHSTKNTDNSYSNPKAKCDWRNIIRTRVKSSNVYAIGYDLLTNTLIVEFKSNKAIYLYYDVSFEIFQKFLNAESKGRFIGYMSTYKYERVF